MRLRFGPYPMPRCKIGGRLDCEYAGTLRIVAISDAPQQWPLGVVKGHRIPVVCGELVRAIKSEAARDIAEAWRGGGLLSKWRKALRVGWTKGDHLRVSEQIRASDPAGAKDCQGETRQAPAASRHRGDAEGAPRLKALCEIARPDAGRSQAPWHPPALAQFAVVVKGGSTGQKEGTGGSGQGDWSNLFSRSSETEGPGSVVALPPEAGQDRAHETAR